jgi:general stress protein YciG
MDKPSTRGFASPKFTPDQRRLISQTGGRAVAREKRAFSSDPELAKRAGSLGGQRRREANLKEIALLREFVDGSLAQVPVDSSGRTLRLVDRLVRLGYWCEMRHCAEPEHRAYIITQPGREFLSWLQTPSGQAYIEKAGQKRTRRKAQ